MLKWYITRPHFIFAILIAFALLGVIGFFNISRDLFPPADRPEIAVVIVEPGASARYVADHVSAVIERELYTLSAIRRVYSTSNDGFCTITAEFHYGKNIGEAKTDVQNGLSKVANLLPSDIQTPQIYEVTSYSQPVITLSISPKKSSSLSMPDVRYIAENQIKDEILRTGKVANIDVFGGYEKDIEIRFDNTKLAALGLSVQDIVSTIQKSNKDIPLGIIMNPNSQYMFKVLTEATNLDMIRNFQITPGVKLKDVAKVDYGYSPPTSFYHGDGAQAIAIAIQRPYGGAVMTTINAVENILPKLRAQFPQLNIQVADTQKELVELSNDNMLEALRDAIIFTAIVIFLFLADLRLTLISAISIPFVYLATIAIMWILHIGFNIVSLTGVILALGMLVDDAIVILENIERHFTQLKETPLDAAINGTKEVMLVIFGGTLATSVVLLPLMFVGGYPAQIFIPLAGTLLIAIIVSYFVSITLIPILSIKMLKADSKRSKFETKVNNIMNYWLDPFKQFYSNAVKFLIDNKKMRMPLTLPLLPLLMLSIGVVIPTIGRDLMPPMDTGIAKANITFDSNTSILKVNQTLFTIEKYVKSLGDVEMMSDAIGSEPGVLTVSAGPPQVANMTIHFVNRFKRSATIWQLEDKIRNYIRTLPGVKYADVYDFGATPLSSIKAPLDTTIYGNSVESVNRAGNVVMQAMKNVKGLKSYSKNWDMDNLEYVFKIDHLKTAYYETTPYDVASQLSAGIQGATASIYTVPNETGYLIKVILPTSSREYVKDLKTFLIKTPKGFIPLESFGTLSTIYEPTIITREAMMYTQDVMGYRSTFPITHIMGSFTPALKKAIGENKGKIASDVELKQTGDITTMMDSMSRMFKAILVGFILLYLVLVPIFRSWLNPLAIMAAIPLSIIGGAWSLLIADKTMCLPAIMGFVLLSGIIVKNSILIIDFIKTYLDKGYGIEEAVLQSIHIRTRPVMMTALGTAVGMIPIAMQWAIGLERLSPLAVVAIGGLIFGTFLSLIYVPFFSYFLTKKG